MTDKTIMVIKRNKNEYNRHLVHFKFSFKVSRPSDFCQMWRWNYRGFTMFATYDGVLGWLLAVVLFAQIRKGPLGSVPSIACCNAWCGSTSLQQSFKGSCSLHVAGHNLRADCHGVPWLLRSTAVPMQLSYQCRHCQCNVTAVQALMLAVLALKQPAI